MDKYPPTLEQQLAIKQSETLKSFKVSAYAGTGKTSTLTFISEHLYEFNGSKGLYLAFNKTIAEEASTKLHPSVECRTFHSLAYKNVGKALTSKVKYPKEFPQSLAERFKAEDLIIEVCAEEIEQLKKIGEFKNKSISSSKLFSAAVQMQCVNESIVNFCRSTDDYISLHHISLPKWAKKDGESVIEVKNKLLEYSRKRWEELVDTSNNINISHDVYLKVWSLSNPVIHADYILFDEAQDADNVQLKILSNQKCPVIYVGDKSQQIYEFRGAVNAMQQLEIPELKLTQSFRFGTAIAMYANKILCFLDETIPLKGFEKIPSKVHKEPNKFVPDAILCRTNKGAFSELINAIRLKDGRSYSIQANIEEITAFIKAAERLKSNLKPNHSDLDNFSNWDELLEYSKLNPTDQEISGIVRIMNEFEDSQLLLKTLTQCVENDKVDCIISTAHKSKGLEWDNVKLGSDYKLNLNEDDIKDNLIKIRHEYQFHGDIPKAMNDIKNTITSMPDSELRLLYVAITRAKVNLDMTTLSDFFDYIDKAFEIVFMPIESSDLRAELA